MREARRGEARRDEFGWSTSEDYGIDNNNNNMMPATCYTFFVPCRRHLPAEAREQAHPRTNLPFGWDV